MTICGLAIAISPVPALANPILSDAELKELREQARAIEHGEGVARDPARAIALYCQGARAGDPEAAYSLGWMYANGRGVPRDDSLAAYFLEFAVRKDHGPSRQMLGFISTPAAAMPRCMQPNTAPLWTGSNVFSDVATQYNLHGRLRLISGTSLRMETSLRFNSQKQFGPEQSLRDKPQQGS